MPLPASTHHDVVIVGARAAGAATALLLARAGLDVLVVDRSPAGTDTLSTHALLRPGVVQLHRWGVLDAVIAAATPPVRRTTFVYADQVVPIPIQPAHGVDALYAPRRTILDPILATAAAEAGAEFRYETAVTGVIRDASGRVAGVEGTAGGRRVEHQARWVIGADGVRSVIARAVDAPVERQGTGAVAAVYGYWSDLFVDGYEWIFRTDGCAGAMPTNHGQTCVFSLAPLDRIGRGGLDTLRRGVAAASPSLAERLAGATPPAGVRSFPGLPGYMREPWGPGWALVGDAGYWKDPISAHGLSDALRDAELLARAVICAAAGQPEAVALDEYHPHPEPALHPPVRRGRPHRRHALDRRRDPRPAPRPQHRHERGNGRPRRPARPRPLWEPVMNLGDTASRTRTVTADDIERFTALTGDRNPLHYDADAAAATRFGGIVVQGGVTSGLLNAVVAEDLPGPGSVFLHTDWSYRAPVRPGDTITATVEVTDMRHDKPITTLRTFITNQQDVVVLEGTALVWTEALPSRR